MAKVKVTKAKEGTEMTLGPSDFTTDNLPRRDGSVEGMRSFLRPTPRVQCDPINGMVEPSVEMDMDGGCYEEPKVK